MRHSLSALCVFGTLAACGAAEDPAGSVAAAVTQRSGAKRPPTTTTPPPPTPPPQTTTSTCAYAPAEYIGICPAGCVAAWANGYGATWCTTVCTWAQHCPPGYACDYYATACTPACKTDADCAPWFSKCDPYGYCELGSATFSSVPPPPPPPPPPCRLDPSPATGPCPAGCDTRVMSNGATWCARGCVNNAECGDSGWYCDAFITGTCLPTCPNRICPSGFTCDPWNHCE